MKKKVLVAAASAAALMSCVVSANAATLSIDTLSAAGTTSIAALGGDYNPLPGPTSPPLDPNETLYIFNDTTQGFGLNVNIGAGEPGAVLTYTFLGYEASFDNRSFELAGTQSFSNQDAGTIGNSVGQVETCGGVMSCLAQFRFTSTHSDTTFSAVNGGPMDDFGPTSPLQIAFGYLTTSSVLVFFDDGGAGSDRDFDDMVLQISVRAANIEEVPLPAPILLLLSGLIGLGFLGRFRRGKAVAA